MWSRHLQHCFNSWPSSCTREIRLKSAPQIFFVPSTLSPAPVLFSSPTLLVFNKHLGRTIHTWCIDPYPVVEERGRGVGDGKGFRIDWEENEKLWRQGVLSVLETLPHSSTTLPSLNMHRSYLLVSKALCFW